MKIHLKTIASLFFYIIFSLNIIGQNIEDNNEINITSVVKNENGNPIKGANIYLNSTSKIGETDRFGRFSVSIPENSDLMINADGYQPHIYASFQIENLEDFPLETVLYYSWDKDDINIAFNTKKRKDIIGAVSVIHPDEIRKYDNNLMLSDALIGRVPGLIGSSNIRGLGGSVLYIVDGLPRDISNLKMSEVEQVSFLKDLHSSVLYGNSGSNGVVYVSTKRGDSNKQLINVSAQYGVSLPKLLPKYLSSAEYMGLYNEARLNDGLGYQFSEDQIENYRTGDKYRYPNVDYYSSDYLRNHSNFFNVETEFSGGNEFVAFYANAGWRQNDSYLNFGEGKNQFTNVFNLRGNIDINVSSFLKSSIDAVAVLDDSYGPVGNSYWSEVANFKPHMFTPLIPIDRINPEDNLLLNRKNDINGQYLLGGTQEITSNPIATILSGGKISPRTQRTFSFSQRNEFNLSGLTEGLTFHTNLNFDFYSTYTQSVRYDYSVYEPLWDKNDSIQVLKQYGKDTRSGVQSVGNASFVRSFNGYAMFDYDRTFNDVHYIGGSLLGFGSYLTDGLRDIQGTKNLNLGLRFDYMYDKKYIFNFNGAYNHSVKLPKGNRSAFSPFIGLGWVISSEDFLSTINFIDYLKLKVTGGILNSDRELGQHFLYDSRSTSSGSYSWYEGQWSNSATISSRAANMNLFFEKRQDFNFGLEGFLFNRLIGFDANFFHQVNDNQITRPVSTYPSFYSDFAPYENINKTSFHGVDLGITLNKKVGDLSFVLGLNTLYTNSEVVKRDEIYRNEYQYRTGKPFDALFALEADNFFMDETEIANHPLQAFGSVQPGDIKYIDQNGDGIIDAEDEVKIGRSQAPYNYGIHLKLNWKNLTLFALGNGRSGAHSFKQGNYYWVDGDKKYSNVVLDRWTEETKLTATYPRLSSVSNNNNFRRSTFWMYKSDYFTIDRVQLTYQLPSDIISVIYMNDLHVYIDGTNLIRFSKNRDIQDLNVSGTPYSRSFSLGVRMMF